jgi:sugar O-acyltransferase (sialic acid O-acetyltransferase NeuD family)
VVVDILQRMADLDPAITVVGVLDDDPVAAGRMCLGVPVVGPIALRRMTPHDAVVIAIGSNRTREQLAVALAADNERFVTACHPSAILARDVVLGPGAMVCAGAVVNTGSVIGSHAILNTGCTVDHHNTIGECAHIAPGAHLGGEVRVGVGAFVGLGALVLPRRSVGDRALVGAGAVVTRDIAADVTAFGVPAMVRVAGKN